MQVRPSKRPFSSRASRPPRPVKAKRALTPAATPPWQRRAMARQGATNPWEGAVPAPSPFAKDASGAPAEAIASLEAKQPVAAWWGAPSRVSWPALDHTSAKMVSNVHFRANPVASARCKVKYHLTPVSERTGACTHDMCVQELMRVATCPVTHAVMCRAIKDIATWGTTQPLKPAWRAAIVGRDANLAAFLLADAFRWSGVNCTVSFEQGADTAPLQCGCALVDAECKAKTASAAMRTRMWYAFGYDRPAPYQHTVIDIRFNSYSFLYI